jgi:hypothetical protein
MACGGSPIALTATRTGWLGPLGMAVILALYGLAAWRGPAATQKRFPASLPTALVAGGLAALVLAGEIVLEYILLPQDNSSMGLIEYSLVLALFGAAGLRVAWQSDSFRGGVAAAVWSALLASLAWYAAALLVFYLFNGSPQQAQVFRAEGNFSDFAASGMNDFNAWIMQDFLGAGFFHSLLLPTLGAIVGALGAAIGRLAARLGKAGI